MKRPIIILFLFLTFACGDDGDVKSVLLDNSIPGTWLFTEYGYSPGAGYFTEPVAAVPAQTISFGSDLTLTTNIDGLKKYNFYRILEDPNSDQNVIAFFIADPGNAEQDVLKLEHSYSMSQEGNLLKLHFRWCIEGCHIGLKKISGSGDKQE